MSGARASLAAHPVYEFEGCRLDLATRELYRAGKSVHVQPKAFDVLCYLIESRDRVVGKDELLAKLWPEEIVAETSLTFAIKSVRRAVGDDGATQRTIRTVHGRGYRFVAELHETAPEAPGRSAVHAHEAGTPSSQIALSSAAHEAGRATTKNARDRILLQPAAASFVGREDELGILESELTAALGGQTRTAFVLGEPGVGKSRLVAELCVRAEEHDVTVLVGRCYEGLPPAFWPWIQMLRSYAEQFGREAAREACGDGLGDLGRVMPGLLEASEKTNLERATGDGDAEQARLRLFDSIVGFLREATRMRPAIVVLDDLHWADSSSLLVLRHLMRELLDSRLLVVGTYRHMEVLPDSALNDLVGWLHRTRRTTRVKLVGLADEDVATLVRELSGDEPAAEVAAELGRVTDGNPFFIEEFCRDVAEAGVGLESFAARKMPEQVRDVLLARVQRLDASTRDVLAVAAVFGREFRHEDVRHAWQGDEADVSRAFEEAEAAGLVQGDDARAGAFAFAHALVSEALRESLGSIRRAELHRRAAEALEFRTGGDALVRATAIAHHWSQAAAAGHTHKAFEWERNVGNMLVARFAYEDAAVHYERALALARQGACDESELYEMLLALVRTGHRTGGDDRSLLTEAVAIAHRMKSTAMLARAALTSTTLFPATPSERVELLESALAALRAEPEADRRLLARVLAALASGLYSTVGEVHRREALVGEALDIARETEDTRTLLRVIRASHVALWRPGYLDRRLELAREHVAVAERERHPIESASARTWYVPALIERRRVEEADRQIDLLEAEAVETRMPVYLANALSFRAMRSLSRGCFDEVENLAQRSYELSRRYNETTASMTLWSQIYYLRREQGRLAEIEAGLHLFASQVAHVSWDWLNLHLLCEDGRPGQAQPILDGMRADRFADGLPDDAHIVSSAALFGLVESAWRLRDEEAAAMLLPHLDRYRGQWVTVGLGGVCLGPVSYAAGLALATMGRSDDAIASLEEAERELDATDMLVPLARTRVELASVLLARRDRDSRSRARRLLAAVGRTAENHGLAHIGRLLEAAGA